MTDSSKSSKQNKTTQAAQAQTESKADKVIHSYLDDLFSLGDSNPLVAEASDGFEDEVILVEDSEALDRQLKEALASASIEKHHSLITTIDLMAASQSKAMLSKPQSFLMLLISLYYLRRPLPDGVKQRFLDVSERMLDDYEAADWQAEVTRPNGVLSEARSEA